MNVNRQLDRLERAAANIPVVGPRCRACGVPEGSVLSYDEHDPEGRTLFPTCGVCGFPVQPDGHARDHVPAGTPHKVVIVDPWAPAF